MKKLIILPAILFCLNASPQWIGIGIRIGNLFHRTETTPPDSIKTFAVTSAKDDTLTIASEGYPADGDSIRAMTKAGSTPSSRTDGTLLYAGSDTSAVDGDYKVTQSDTSVWYVTGIRVMSGR
jgi:hypothetical protein